MYWVTDAVDDQIAVDDRINLNRNDHQLDNQYTWKWLIVFTLKRVWLLLEKWRFEGENIISYLEVIKVYNYFSLYQFNPQKHTC